MSFVSAMELPVSFPTYQNPINKTKNCPARHQQDCLYESSSLLDYITNIKSEFQPKKKKNNIELVNFVGNILFN